VAFIEAAGALFVQGYRQGTAFFKIPSGYAS
jgi:hypothetical protein